MTEDIVRSLYVQADTIPWQPLYPGVDTKTLLREPSQNLVVMLMRYQPGAVIPQHRHTAVEHVFVLDGCVEDEFGRLSTLGTTPCVHRVVSMPRQ